MKNCKEVKYEKENIEKYITEILSSGQNSFFLKEGFVFEKENVYGEVDIEDFVQLSKIKKIDESQAMNLLAEFLKGMMESERNYIFEDNYNIDEDNIYVDKDLKNIKILYSPSLEGRYEEKIKFFLSLLKEKSNKGGIKYIEQAEYFLQEKGALLPTFLAFTEMLQREIYLCSGQ